MSIKSKITKSIQLILATLLFVALFANAQIVITFAQQSLVVRTTEELRVDTSYVRDDNNFTVPDRVVIVPVYPLVNNSLLTPLQHYRGIYFYTVEILGFNDVPFHYFITEEGEVFKGNKGGDERQINIDGVSGNPIVVGYLTNRSSLNFSEQSRANLNKLISNVVNLNAIDPDNLQIEGIEFVRDTEVNTVRMKTKDLFGNWNSSHNNIVNFTKENYAPVQKDYTVKVVEIDIPENEVKPGEIVEVTITLENTSFFGIYSGSDNEIYLTKNSSGTSLFHVNGEWASTTQASIMSDQDILLPMDNKTFTFKIKAPLAKGLIEESFTIKTLNGNTVSADNIKLYLNIGDTDKQILEILPTETGTLNVRVEPSSVGNIVTQVSPGERFFIISDAGNGWLEIDLGDGRTGWVASWLARIL